MNRLPPATPGASGPDVINRRQFVQTAATGAAAVAVFGPASSATGAPAPAAASPRPLAVPLSDATNVRLEGPHRFRTVRGRTGLQVLSLHTRAVVTTELPRSPQGTVSFWFSPLEDLTFLSKPNGSSSKVAFDFPFFADVFPPRRVTQARFAVNFTVGYPALMARFAAGEVWRKLDYGLAPFVYAEKAVLRRGAWYHVALTWDRAAKTLVLFLNGLMAGHNLRADNFEEPAAELFLGNPSIVLADLRLEARVAGPEEMAAAYAAGRPPTNQLADADTRQLLVPGYLAPLDLRRDAAWKPALECAFTRAGDLEQWVRQGPRLHLEDFRMETSAEGLLLRTPSPVHTETRMYLWSQRTFEGDQWIEFDFRLESPRGLALLATCVSGMQREDFFADHGVPATGSMGTILNDVRCYHWEFVRRVEAMRNDVETQYVAKNAVGVKLISRCVPRLEQNRWYRLRFVKAGARLHGAFDGQTVFDVRDNAWTNNGPVYDFGRIGLRHMYDTALRYRNLVVYQRDSGDDALA